MRGLRRDRGFRSANVFSHSTNAGFALRFVDLPRAETLAERAERDEPYARFVERPQDVLFGLAPPSRVLTLQRRHRLDGVGKTNRSRSCFRKTDWTIPVARTRRMFA